MQAFSDNTNDSKVLSEITKPHTRCSKAAQNCLYFIARATLYTEKIIRSLDEQQQKFIARVPITTKSTEETLLDIRPDLLTSIGNGDSDC